MTWIDRLEGDAERQLEPVWTAEAPRGRGLDTEGPSCDRTTGGEIVTDRKPADGRRQGAAWASLARLRLARGHLAHRVPRYGKVALCGARPRPFSRSHWISCLGLAVRDCERCQAEAERIEREGRQERRVIQ